MIAHGELSYWQEAVALWEIGCLVWLVGWALTKLFGPLARAVWRHTVEAYRRKL